MESSITAYLVATGAVVLAEMGDKTQLLAMAYAARYRATKVMLGVLLATVLNHAMAVAAGFLLASIKEAAIWIQAAASVSFIGFGLWTLRKEKAQDCGEGKGRFGPVLTVAVAFFIAELGDKTQLATISLAAKFPDSPVAVLMGTTTGMLVADALGVFFGAMLYRVVPGNIIRLISAGAFIMFGYVGCYEVLAVKLSLAPAYVAIIMASILLLSIIAGYALIKKGEGCDE